MSKFNDGKLNIKKVKFSELLINSDVEEIVANKVTNGAGMSEVGAAAVEEEKNKDMVAIFCTVFSTLVLAAILIAVVYLTIKWENGTKKFKMSQKSEIPEKVNSNLDDEAKSNLDDEAKLTDELKNVITKLGECTEKMSELKSAVSVCTREQQKMGTINQRAQQIMAYLNNIENLPNDKDSLKTLRANVGQKLTDLYELGQKKLRSGKLTSFSNLCNALEEFKESVGVLDSFLIKAKIIVSDGNYSNLDFNKYTERKDAGLDELVRQFNANEPSFAEIHASIKEDDVSISSDEGTQISVNQVFKDWKNEQEHGIKEAINEATKLRDAVLQKLSAVEEKKENLRTEEEEIEEIIGHAVDEMLAIIGEGEKLETIKELASEGTLVITYENIELSKQKEYYWKIYSNDRKVGDMLRCFNLALLCFRTGVVDLENVEDDLNKVLSDLSIFEKLLENFKEGDAQSEKAKKIKDACDKYLEMKEIVDTANIALKKFGSFFDNFDNITCKKLQLRYNEFRYLASFFDNIICSQLKLQPRHDELKCLVQYLEGLQVELKYLEELQLQGYANPHYVVAKGSPPVAASVYEIVNRRVFHMNNQETYKALIPRLREQVEKFQELRTRKEDYEKISQKANEEIRNIVSNKNFNHIVKCSTDGFNFMEFSSKMKIFCEGTNERELAQKIELDNDSIESYLYQIKKFLGTEKPSDKDINGILFQCAEMEKLLKNFNETRTKWAEERKEIGDIYINVAKVIDAADQQLQKLCIHIKAGEGEAEDTCRQMIGVGKKCLVKKGHREVLYADNLTHPYFEPSFHYGICHPGVYTTASKALEHIKNKGAYIKLVEDLRSRVEELRGKAIDLQNSPSK